MDSWMASAARQLAAGNPLGALKRVALRKDPPALAMRGIAMAQLGDYQRARELMRLAARGFGSHERLAKARCRLAEAEMALAAKDLTRPLRFLPVLAATLFRLGDRANALHAEIIQARKCLLEGRLHEVEKILGKLRRSSTSLSPFLAARFELLTTEVALRRVRVQEARLAFERARNWAGKSGISALVAEVENMGAVFADPAAHWIQSGTARPIRLIEVETELSLGNVVVDGCRRVLVCGSRQISLARSPVLFELLMALAEVWPAGLSRDELVLRTFKPRVVNASHRVRLRVELGRLRRKIWSWVRIEATPLGYAMVLRRGCAVGVLAPFRGGVEGSILALLQSGEAWSTSALAGALGLSQRNVQRWLLALTESGEVRCMGRGRARRWLSPPVRGIATTLLLPGSLTLS